MLFLQLGWPIFFRPRSHKFFANFVDFSAFQGVFSGFGYFADGALQSKPWDPAFYSHPIFQRGYSDLNQVLDFFFLDFCRSLRRLFYPWAQLPHGQFLTSDFLRLSLIEGRRIVRSTVSSDETPASRVGFWSWGNKLLSQSSFHRSDYDYHLIYPIVI